MSEDRINDGGNAFPHVPVFFPSGDLMTGGAPGMSLRDWFAGQALAGILANPERGADWEGFAHDAYKFADAMLVERAKEVTR